MQISERTQNINSNPVPQDIKKKDVVYSALLQLIFT